MKDQLTPLKETGIKNNIDKMLSKLPITLDWCTYKGEIFVALIKK